MSAIRLAGPLVLALFGLGWLALSLAGDKAALRQQLTQAELNTRQQAVVLAQIEQRNTRTLEEIDRAQRDKSELAARSVRLRHELADLQAGHPCVDEPVPVAVTDRLRERVNTANAAAGLATAVAEPVPDPGL